MTGPVSYATAGVDIDAGERAVELMRTAVARSSRPEVLGGLGGFAGLFRLDLTRYRRPVLATSTDGVGTKVAVARMLDRHDTIGLDLVAMVVDDIVVCGGEPLFLTDYIACGKIVPERIATIVAGIAEGCRIAGCALIGGETAEHPGLLEPDEYDLAGAATGVVEEDALLGPHRVTAGDAVVAMASSGLHANGYSLVRHIFFTLAGWRLDRYVPELGRSLGDELLTPTTIYAPHCLRLREAVDVHAFAHITGGGLAGNVARVIPEEYTAVIDRSTWHPPSIFRLVGELGRVPQPELERALNMGIGMVAIVASPDADRAVELLNATGIRAWVAGYVQPRADDAAARLVGVYR